MQLVQSILDQVQLNTVVDVGITALLIYGLFSLIRGTRAKMFLPEIVRLSNSLLADDDDMVKKGLGWLLRETAKFDAKRTVPYLMKLRGRAPRLVLRTAGETLPSSVKRSILSAEKT